MGGTTMQDGTSYVMEGADGPTSVFIGGADGPTSIFLAGETGSSSWLNLAGLVSVILILLPNIIYAVKRKSSKKQEINKGTLLLEQIGRYASMFLMLFNIGIAEFGFAGIGAFFAYFIVNIILLIIYLTTWILYFRKETFAKSMILAIAPTLIFLISGITLRHYLLVASALIFGISHIYITMQTCKCTENVDEE